MKIIKATEAIPVEHPVFCLFGQPGIGKSTLGYSAAAPLTLDFDKGAHRAANRQDTLVIDTWADVIELMGQHDVLASYSTIVVDTVGRCLDVMTAHIAQTDPKKAPGGNLSLQGWGLLKAMFRAWVAQLRALGKDVVLIAHHKEDKDGDLTIVRPDIAGASYGEVMKVADFVGFVYMNGKARVLDFNPTDRWVGKNPGNWNPFQVPPVGQATTFMAGLIAQGRDALGHISEQSAAIVRQLEEWDGRIAAIDTPEALTALIAEANALPPILMPQVKKRMQDFAKTAGFTYDAKKQAFVAAAKKAQPEPAGATA